MARILRIYVIREIAFPTLLALLTVTFIMMIQFIFQLMDLVLQPTISLGQIFGVLSSLIPSLLIFAAPMAILIGVMIGVGRMALDREVTALRASGVNLLTIFVPAMSLALGASLVILLLSGSYVPQMMQLGMDRVNKLKFVVINSLEPGQFHESLGDASSGTEAILFFRDRDPETNEIKGVTIKMEGALPGQASGGKSKKKNPKVDSTADGAYVPELPEGSATMIFAESGLIEAETVDIDQNGKQDNSIALSLTNGSIHRLALDSEKRDYIIGHFDSLKWVVYKAQGEDKVNKNRTNAELKTFITDKSQKESRRGEARRELVERRTIAFASLVFALLGIPLAIMIRPSGKSWGILIAVGLMLIYYVAMQMGLAMVKSGKPLGVAAAFMPNVVYLALGAGLWWRTLRS